MKSKFFALLLFLVVLLGIVGLVLLLRSRPERRATSPTEQVQETTKGTEDGPESREHPSAEVSPVPEEPTAEGPVEESGEEEVDDEVPWGFLFVGGHYVPPPYKVEIKDFTVLVNGQTVFDFTPAPDPYELSEEEIEEEEAYWRQMDPEERRLRKSSDEVAGVIGNNIGLWTDLYTFEEAKEHVRQVLKKAKEDGRIIDYKLSLGKSISVGFYDADGNRLGGMAFLPGVLMKSLGPPYKEYELGTEKFEESLLEIANFARQRYDEQVSTAVISNFLKSQSSVSEFVISEDRVVLRGAGGREVTLKLAANEEEDEETERMAALKRRAETRAKRLSKSLSRGCAVFILSSGEGVLTIPFDMAESVLLRMLDIVQNRDLTAEEKLERMPEEIMALFDKEVVESFGEQEALLERLK